MKSLLRKSHLIVGLILLVIFPLTGAYLRYRIPHLMQESDRFRFSMRGNHVYILLSGLIHLSLGAYLRRIQVNWLSKLQAIGSILLTGSSIIVLAAFFLEPKTALSRPYTSLAMFIALAGMLLHGFCGLMAEAQET